MDNQELGILLEKYITGDLSPAERMRLAQLIGQPGQQENLEGFVRQVMMSDDFAGGDDVRIKEAIMARLEKGMAELPGEKASRVFFIRWAAAAAVVILLAGGAWLWHAGTSEKPPSVAQQPVHDVLPGHEGAILTLADGRQIVLDSSGNGALVRQGNASVTRVSAGELSYRAESTSESAGAGMVYNTLTTPRGRRTSVLLSDGTRVWLNAASSIRYPTVFSGKNRTVEVSGEAYFEVAKGPAMPFIVRTMGSSSRLPVEIQVLGTSFNITAYSDDDEISTTLTEGSVKVINGAAAVLMAPGQQMVAKDKGKLEPNPGVDVEKVVAWKDGYFLFHNDDLPTIMKQLSRWYDIEVHFDGTVSGHYTGKISRQVNISQVLNIFQAVGGVKFSVQNKEVSVLPPAR
ncbi:MAG: hypothetical protein BGO55_21905 [Sphingobacteriales bacterium 50-39]|nr:FecR domain-containing protein [Sphingobacteriales bacterium]OJW59634.1 MAG: hypothetical protein BGO55_21905 [Sphingobacteriales bacterium 50-39]